MGDKGETTPTEATPEQGIVLSYGHLVSRAAHWVEDGIHVIRSLEFDVIAGDPDFTDAVEKFGEKAEDLWRYLSELESLTDNENETYLILAPRFHKIYKELERREKERRRQLISINFSRLRSRGEHDSEWQIPSPQAQSSLVSRA